MATTTIVVAVLAAVLAVAARGASVPDHDLFSISTPLYDPPTRTLKQAGACPCLRRQILGNCGPICSCLDAQRLPTLPKGSCLAVCQSCDRRLRAGCPAGGTLPAECLMPMRYATPVQRCRAVAKRRC